MSTCSANNPGSRPEDFSPSIAGRKQSHLDICKDPSLYATASGVSSGFEAVRLIHDALPETAMSEIDSSVDFLNHRVRLPLFISCMTGGSAEGMTANRELAQAANEKNIPVGLGSIRVLFDKPDLFEHFDIKPYAPNVPIFANIGAVQTRQGDRSLLYRLLERLAVHALVIHLNPGQELFQPGGDSDFRGLLDAIEKTVKTCSIPVMVKETGFGIKPSRIKALLDRGVAYVDIAGAGGTNWVLVESHRLNKSEQELAQEFSGWGLPTALVLAAIGPMNDRILASGGLSTGLDLVKAVALGAKMGGMAGLFIRDVLSGGTRAVVERIAGIERVFKTALLLTGSKTVADLRRKNTHWLEPYFEQQVEAFKKAEEIS